METRWKVAKTSTGLFPRSFWISEAKVRENVMNVKMNVPMWAMAEVLRHKLSEPLMKMIELIKMMESEYANVMNVAMCGIGCAWVGRITFF